jgi:hypothetical protein
VPHWAVAAAVLTPVSSSVSGGALLQAASGRGLCRSRDVSGWKADLPRQFRVRLKSSTCIQVSLVAQRPAYSSTLWFAPELNWTVTCV